VPTAVAALARVGRLLLSLGRRDEAERAFLCATDLRTTHETPYDDLAALREADGRVREGLALRRQHLDALDGVFGPERRRQQVVRYLALADRFRAAGDEDGWRSCVERALTSYRSGHRHWSVRHDFRLQGLSHGLEALDALLARAPLADPQLQGDLLLAGFEVALGAFSGDRFSASSFRVEWLRDYLDWCRAHAPERIPPAHDEIRARLALPTREMFAVPLARQALRDILDGLL
jgi:hypothetical protein